MNVALQQESAAHAVVALWHAFLSQSRTAMPASLAPGAVHVVIKPASVVQTMASASPPSSPVVVPVSVDASVDGVEPLLLDELQPTPTDTANAEKAKIPATKFSERIFFALRGARTIGPGVLPRKKSAPRQATETVRGRAV